MRATIGFALVVLVAACGDADESPSGGGLATAGTAGAAGSPTGALGGMAGTAGVVASGQAGTAAGASGANSGQAGAHAGFGGIAAGATSAMGGISGAAGTTAGAAGAGATAAAGSANDFDQDGIDDTEEAQLAESYAPFFSIDPKDNCKLGGIVYRVRPHPQNAKLRHIIYVYLFERDCGLNGHIGDNEVSAITVDPTKPAPFGIVALRSISHQGTICEKITNCGVCPGLPKCDVGPKKGQMYPVIFYSKDKHGSYAQKSACGFLSCLDSCTLAPESAYPIMVNAGEPNHPLTNDLTNAGLITTANGWKEASLFHYDPWKKGAQFGKAGSVEGDLTDPAFDTPACSAP